MIRIAENLSGMSPFPAQNELPVTTNPLAWGVATADVARIGRLLAISELVNHADGWLRRSSKNAVFRMVAEDFPDLVEDEALESLIDRFDERVVAAGGERWHPSFAPLTTATTEPPLLQVPMLRGGVGLTPMWRGRLFDSPAVFQGEGRFAIRIISLSDLSNAEQMRGALESMDEPHVAAALVVFAQALMWHATWAAESFGISVPRVGYVVMREADLQDRIDELSKLAVEQTWPAMDGHVPVDVASVFDVVASMDLGGAISSPGPILRSWVDGTLMVDAHALSIELMHRLRVNPRSGGPRVNATAVDFELSVQKVIDDAGLAPADSIRKLRGVTLRSAGINITDLDAVMKLGSNLICVSCKKFELARPYDAGDYSSVRNAQTNIKKAVAEWGARIAQLDVQRVGDNFDLSQFDQLIGLVVTPKLAFIDDADSWALVRLTETVEVPRYLSFGELVSAVQHLSTS